jgi:transposase InsO family protein
MTIVSQAMHHRQRMVKYFLKNGDATRTAIRYRVSRKTLYKWVSRYDGTPESLLDQSKKPHNSPKAQTAEEMKMVKNTWIKDKGDDKLVMWYKAGKKGYKRCYQTFLRTVRKLEGEVKKPKPKKKSKPYMRAEYPGQKVQIDVKYVPSKCVVNGGKYYQFTAIDECSRDVFRQMYDERSTYSAKLFLEEMFEYFPFPIREAQTDNGTEFTNALLVTKAKHKTSFEKALADMDIIYKRIKVATPRHNGKVERQHRKDEQRFYRKMKMDSLEDGRAQLAAYQKKSRHYPHMALGFQSPVQVIEKYLAVM